MTRDELGVAHRLLVSHVQRYGAPIIQEKYFPNQVVNTVKNLTKDNPYGKTQETKDALLGFFKKVVEEAATEIGFYHILKLILDCGDQSSAEKYVGNYVCYRFQSGKDNLLVGSISVEYDSSTASYNFTHRSPDSGLDVTAPLLKHSGPFYVFENRIYLVGIGLDDYGTYLRPIIVQATERPKMVPLRGVVLTEWATGHVPVAARTILYHEELHASMLAMHPNETEFRSHVIKQLRLPSNSEGKPLRATNLMGW